MEPQAWASESSGSDAQIETPGGCWAAPPVSMNLANQVLLTCPPGNGAGVCFRVRSRVPELAQGRLSTPWSKISPRRLLGSRVALNRLVMLTGLQSRDFCLSRQPSGGPSNSPSLSPPRTWRCGVRLSSLSSLERSEAVRLATRATRTIPSGLSRSTEYQVDENGNIWRLEGDPRGSFGFSDEAFPCLSWTATGRR